jgi:hypothetical protein
MRPMSASSVRSGIKELVKMVANSIPIRPMLNHHSATTRSGWSGITYHSIQDPTT